MRFLSTWGSAIVLVATGTVALIVAADVKPQALAAALGARRAARRSGSSRARVGDAVDEHRAAVADLRAEEAALRARRAEEEARALADTADIEAAGEDDRAEARAVAGALALEHVRRTGSFDDPAWVDGLARRRAGPAAADGGRGGAAAAPQAEGPREGEGRAAGGAPPTAASPPPPRRPPRRRPRPPSAVRPEIVVSQAMLERGGKKKKEKKEAPAFAFTKAGDVFRVPSIDLLDVHEEKAKDVDERRAHPHRRRHRRDAEAARHRRLDQAHPARARSSRSTSSPRSPGVKLARIENLDKELTMALSAMRIRIIAPIPGKGVVGIEVPNRDRATVYLRDILESESFAHAGGFLPLGLGKNIEGIPYCVDLQRMPHLLIAGTTGSGKSVGLNTMILSMLYRQTPAEVRMIMVDPKMTELSAYEDIPHLLLPVVTDPQKAARALQWAVDEMERRTQILADTGSKDLRSYNGKVEKLRAEGRTFEDKDAVPPKKLVVVDVTAGETEEQAAARAAAETVEVAGGRPAPGGRRERAPSSRTRPRRRPPTRSRRATRRSCRRSCPTSSSSSTSSPTS